MPLHLIYPIPKGNGQLLEEFLCVSVLSWGHFCPLPLTQDVQQRLEMSVVVTTVWRRGKCTTGF